MFFFQHQGELQRKRLDRLAPLEVQSLVLAGEAQAQHPHDRGGGLQRKPGGGGLRKRVGEAPGDLFVGVGPGGDAELLCRRLPSAGGMGRGRQRTVYQPHEHGGITGDDRVDDAQRLGEALVLLGGKGRALGDAQQGVGLQLAPTFGDFPDPQAGGEVAHAQGHGEKQN